MPQPVLIAIVVSVLAVMLFALNSRYGSDAHHWHEYRGKMRRRRPDGRWEVRDLTPEEKRAQFEELDSGAW